MALPVLTSEGGTLAFQELTSNYGKQNQFTLYTTSVCVLPQDLPSRFEKDRAAVYVVPRLGDPAILSNIAADELGKGRVLREVLTAHPHSLCRPFLCADISGEDLNRSADSDNISMADPAAARGVIAKVCANLAVRMEGELTTVFGPVVTKQVAGGLPPLNLRANVAPPPSDEFDNIFEAASSQFRTGVVASIFMACDWDQCVHTAALAEWQHVIQLRLGFNDIPANVVLLPHSPDYLGVGVELPCVSGLHCVGASFGECRLQPGPGEFDVEDNEVRSEMQKRERDCLALAESMFKSVKTGRYHTRLTALTLGGASATLSLQQILNGLGWSRGGVHVPRNWFTRTDPVKLRYRQGLPIFWFLTPAEIAANDFRAMPLQPPSGIEFRKLLAVSYPAPAMAVATPIDRQLAGASLRAHVRLNQPLEVAAPVIPETVSSIGGAVEWTPERVRAVARTVQVATLWLRQRTRCSRVGLETEVDEAIFRGGDLKASFNEDQLDSLRSRCRVADLQELEKALRAAGAWSTGGGLAMLTVMNVMTGFFSSENEGTGEAEVQAAADSLMTLLSEDAEIARTQLAPNTAQRKDLSNRRIRYEAFLHATVQLELAKRRLHSAETRKTTADIFVSHIRDVALQAAAAMEARLEPIGRILDELEDAMALPLTEEEDRDDRYTRAEWEHLAVLADQRRAEIEQHQDRIASLEAKAKLVEEAAQAMADGYAEICRHRREVLQMWTAGVEDIRAMFVRDDGQVGNPFLRHAEGYVERTLAGTVLDRSQLPIDDAGRPDLAEVARLLAGFDALEAPALPNVTTPGVAHPYACFGFAPLEFAFDRNTPDGVKFMFESIQTHWRQSDIVAGLASLREIDFEPQVLLDGFARVTSKEERAVTLLRDSVAQHLIEKSQWANQRSIIGFAIAVKGSVPDEWFSAATRACAFGRAKSPTVNELRDRIFQPGFRTERLAEGLSNCVFRLRDEWMGLFDDDASPGRPITRAFNERDLAFLKTMVTLPEAAGPAPAVAAADVHRAELDELAARLDQLDGEADPPAPGPKAGKKARAERVSIETMLKTSIDMFAKPAMSQGRSRGFMVPGKYPHQPQYTECVPGAATPFLELVCEKFCNGDAVDAAAFFHQFAIVHGDELEGSSTILSIIGSAGSAKSTALALQMRSSGGTAGMGDVRKIGDQEAFTASIDRYLQVLGDEVQGRKMEAKQEDHRRWTTEVVKTLHHKGKDETHEEARNSMTVAGTDRSIARVLTVEDDRRNIVVAIGNMTPSYRSRFVGGIYTGRSGFGRFNQRVLDGWSGLMAQVRRATVEPGAIVARMRTNFALRSPLAALCVFELTRPYFEAVAVSQGSATFGITVRDLRALFREEDRERAADLVRRMLEDRGGPGSGIDVEETQRVFFFTHPDGELRPSWDEPDAPSNNWHLANLVACAAVTSGQKYETTVRGAAYCDAARSDWALSTSDPQPYELVLALMLPGDFIMLNFQRAQALAPGVAGKAVAVGMHNYRAVSFVVDFLRLALQNGVVLPFPAARIGLSGWRGMMALLLAPWHQTSTQALLLERCSWSGLMGVQYTGPQQWRQFVTSVATLLSGALSVARAVLKGDKSAAELKAAAVAEGAMIARAFQVADAFVSIGVLHAMLWSNRIESWMAPDVGDFLRKFGVGAFNEDSPLAADLKATAIDTASAYGDRAIRNVTFGCELPERKKVKRTAMLENFMRYLDDQQAAVLCEHALRCFERVHTEGGTIIADQLAATALATVPTPRPDQDGVPDLTDEEAAFAEQWDASSELINELGRLGDQYDSLTSSIDRKRERLSAFREGSSSAQNMEAAIAKKCEQLEAVTARIEELRLQVQMEDLTRAGVPELDVEEKAKMSEFDDDEGKRDHVWQFMKGWTVAHRHWTPPAPEQATKMVGGGDLSMFYAAFDENGEIVIDPPTDFLGEGEPVDGDDDTA